MRQRSYVCISALTEGFQKEKLFPTLQPLPLRKIWCQALKENEQEGEERCILLKMQTLMLLQMISWSYF